MKFEARTAFYCPTPPSREDAAAARSILKACREAAGAYRKHLAAGAGRPDAELARDPAYATLLRAGQTIRRLGGEGCVEEAIEFVTELVPGGSARDFDRLWCGLFPQAEA